MKNLLLVIISITCINTSNAQVDALDTDSFGHESSSGTFQEIKIKTFQMNREYFPKDVQDKLLESKRDQKKYKIFPKSGVWTRNFNWGYSVIIYFQDGKLKSEEASSKDYELINKARDYAFVHATLSYDNLKQLKANIYHVDGHVTLVTGDSYFEDSSEPIQIVELNSIMTSKRSAKDNKRIWAIGFVKHSLDIITLGDLKLQMGDYIESITYP